MKIGLCMSVIGAGGGNDTVFNSLYQYLEKQNHKVTPFSNSNVYLEGYKSIIPKFGLFRQLQTINDTEMHNQDLLIFLTGIPPKTKVPIIYYHQQLPFSIFTKQGRPPKYDKGLWKIYYGIFALFAGMKSDRLIDDNVTNYCISEYLQEQLGMLGLFTELVRPSIIQNDLPIIPKQNRIVTICRISPEKNLLWNAKVLSGYKYTIFGTVNNYLAYYCREIEKRLEPQHSLRLYVQRTTMLEYLLWSKVYFSSSKETLGLAVLEGISAGCIPIVVDNTGNRETVPFKELRYQEGDDNHAKELIAKAISGGFDYLLPELQNHIKRYTEDNYQVLLGDNITCKQ